MPSSSQTTHLDCKVASSAGRPQPTKVFRHIQPTFEITVLFTLTNTNIHHDAFIHGYPTKRDRPNSETVLEKVTININLINERSDENKETNYDENNIKNNLKDNNEYKDTTSINSNVNSLDKG